MYDSQLWKRPWRILTASTCGPDVNRGRAPPINTLCKDFCTREGGVQRSNVEDSRREYACPSENGSKRLGGNSADLYQGSRRTMTTHTAHHPHLSLLSYAGVESKSPRPTWVCLRAAYRMDAHVSQTWLVASVSERVTRHGSASDTRTHPNRRH
jgi:hypothetical protein